MNNFKSYIINEYKTNVTALSNYPSDDNISPDQLKAIFDGRTNEEVKDSINGIIGALLAPSAAEQIGAKGGTVEEMLNTKVDKEGAVTSVAGRTGAVTLSKLDVGLERVDNTADADKPVSNAVGEELAKKANKDSPNFEGTLNLGDVKIYVNSDGNLVFHNPSRLDENGFPINPEGTFLISDYLSINGNEVFHRGNLKNLAEHGNVLNEFEKESFMQNTGLDLLIGNIETAIDEIIELQNNLIGGDA